MKKGIPCNDCRYRKYCEDLVYPCNKCGFNYEYFEPITHKLEIQNTKPKTIEENIQSIQYDIRSIKEVIKLLIDSGQNRGRPPVKEKLRRLKSNE